MMQSFSWHRKLIRVSLAQVCICQPLTIRVHEVNEMCFTTTSICTDQSPLCEAPAIFLKLRKTHPKLRK